VPDPYLLTLHTLTLRQLATADQLADIIVQEPGDITASLERGVSEGAAIAARGAFMITPKGRELLDEAYPAWFAEHRTDVTVMEAIERFETGVNKQVLSITTDWQTIEVGGERAANDHSDKDYDARIVDKLGQVHDKTMKVLNPIVVVEPTVDRFLDRISAALTRAEAGETDYVSGVRVDSFHTVWFQMHEHLLRITGTVRPE
jgi:hypothetical protein